MAYRYLDIASGQVTASGNGTGIPVNVSTMGDFIVDITQASGVTAFDLWLQGSNDGVIYADLICDLALKLADTAASGTVRTNVRDIVDAKADNSLETFLGRMNVLAVKYIRAKWKLTGTSITFTVRGGGK